MCVTNQLRNPSSSATSGAHSRARLLEVATFTPACAHSGELLAPVLLRRSPRVVGRPRSPHPRVEEDEAGAALGIGGRKEHTDARARPAGPENGGFRAGRVHHCAHVVHRRFERLHLADAIRQAGPALVEHEHAAARGKTLDVTHEQRLLPGRQEVSGNPTDEDDVGRALADDLVGDRDVAATGVLHVGYV